MSIVSLDTKVMTELSITMAAQGAKKTRIRPQNARAYTRSMG